MALQNILLFVVGVVFGVYFLLKKIAVLLGV